MEAWGQTDAKLRGTFGAAARVGVGERVMAAMVRAATQRREAHPTSFVVVPQAAEQVVVGVRLECVKARLGLGWSAERVTQRISPTPLTGATIVCILHCQPPE